MQTEPINLLYCCFLCIIRQKWFISETYTYSKKYVFFEGVAIKKQFEAENNYNMKPILLKCKNPQETSHICFIATSCKWWQERIDHNF